MNRSFRSILALAGLLVCLGSAHAELTAEVRDEASPKFFKPETVTEANEIIREIKREHKKDLLIETFTDVPTSYEEAVKKDRGKGFAEWARARAKTAEVNGVYILMTHNPAHLQVEVGNETEEKAFTLENRDHLAKLMLGHLKEKENDRALLEGVKYVRDTMNANLKKKPTPSAAGSHEAAPPARGEETSGFTLPSLFGMGIFGWLCVGLVVIAIVWVVIAVIRAISGIGRAGGAGGYGGGYGGGGYGASGYGGGGGGGFMSSMLGGLFGGVAGSWIYDRFFGGGSVEHTGSPSPSYGDGSNAPAAATPQDTDYSGTGGDFDQGSADAGGSDTGGGGDFGGGNDAGGGDFSGGDSGGGGDFGGGDSGGGGDFGGGGGDSGGGGGDF